MRPHSPAEALSPTAISLTFFFYLNRRIATLQSAEFAPTCAIVGGILGQDVLNAVGGKEEPVRNLLVYEGQTGQARVWGLGV